MLRRNTPYGNIIYMLRLLENDRKTSFLTDLFSRSRYKWYNFLMEDTRKGYLLSKIVYLRVRDWTSGRSLSEQSFIEQPPTPPPPPPPSPQSFPKVARQLFGNLQYFEQLFSFQATFCIISEQNQFSFNSEISEQLLVLKLALLPYCAVFQQTIYEFPMKKGARSSTLGGR